MPFIKNPFKKWKKYFGHHKKSQSINIFQLPVHLQERIAAKFEWRSYFRMQQTCHDMANFIQTNRHVKICLPDRFSLEISIQDDGFPRYYLRWSRVALVDADFESLYGVWFNTVRFTREEDDLFYSQQDQDFLDDFCNLLLKYRIGSNELDSVNLRVYTSEQYEELLKILKPVKIYAAINTSDLFGVFLNAEYLRHAKLFTKLEFVENLDLMLKLLKKFQNLEISALANKVDCHFLAIRIILQCLHSQTSLNLRSFTFEGVHPGGRPLISPEELLETFRDFNWIHLDTTTHSSEEPYQHKFECQPGPSIGVCQLEVFLYSISLQLWAY